MYMYVHVRMSVYCQCLSEQALCTQCPLYTLHVVVVQEHRLRGFTSEVTECTDHFPVMTTTHIMTCLQWVLLSTFTCV